jgi:hypothetical protein
MKELAEITLDDSRLVLSNNLVRSAILPRNSREMTRDVEVSGETEVKGALYAHALEVRGGPLTVYGPVFAQEEIHVAPETAATTWFRRVAASAGAISAQAAAGRCLFGADINAKTVSLRNSIVAACVFADEVDLKDCVVLGGVFAVRRLSLDNCVIGTFNSPSVLLKGDIYLLLPSAFSVEPVSVIPPAKIHNLALADLGALMRGIPPHPNTGRVTLDPVADEQKTTLVDDAGNHQVLTTYSIAGRVLAADLTNLEKLQNHFLLTAGSLGAQLLKTYSLGADKDGNPVELTLPRIADFFFDLLHGRTLVPELSGSFSIKDFPGQ